MSISMIAMSLWNGGLLKLGCFVMFLTFLSWTGGAHTLSSQSGFVRVSCSPNRMVVLWRKSSSSTLLTSHQPSTVGRKGCEVKKLHVSILEGQHYRSYTLIIIHIEMSHFMRWSNAAVFVSQVTDLTTGAGLETAYLRFILPTRSHILKYLLKTEFN